MAAVRLHQMMWMLLGMTPAAPSSKGPLPACRWLQAAHPAISHCCCDSAGKLGDDDNLSKMQLDWRLPPGALVRREILPAPQCSCSGSLELT